MARNNEGFWRHWKKEKIWVGKGEEEIRVLAPKKRKNLGGGTVRSWEEEQVARGGDTKAG